jgi:hypothetical protein
MSTLPKGTAYARQWLESVVLKGVEIKAAALWPWGAATPGVSTIYLGLVKHFFEKIALDPSLDEATVMGLALVYVIDHKGFDRSFLKIKMLDKQAATPAQIEEVLRDAENDMGKFLHRGPIT